MKQSPPGTTSSTVASNPESLACSDRDVPSNVQDVPMHDYHDITSTSLLQGKRANPSNEELSQTAQSLVSKLDGVLNLTIFSAYLCGPLRLCGKRTAKQITAETQRTTEVTPRRNKTPPINVKLWTNHERSSRISKKTPYARSLL